MNIQSNTSGHWTDDQLIAHLYGIGSEDQQHLEVCSICQTRFSAMQVLQTHQADDDVSADLLAAQRRNIYARLTPSHTWHSAVGWRRWASVGAATLLFAGSMLWYQASEASRSFSNELSDAQLAQDVSLMSQTSEAQPTAPLQALFEE